MEETTRGVVAFAFGIPASIVSNRKIAVMAASTAKLLSAPIYTQSEEYLVFPPDLAVERVDEEPGQPAPTLRIARSAVTWARSKGMDTLWIACAKPHYWRCKRDLEMAAAEMGLAVEIFTCAEVSASAWSEWFCRDSLQLNSRSKVFWLVRDFILWCMPFSLYKRIAS